MDEQRQDAYFQLINALLTYPSSKIEILQTNRNLLDVGLLRTMRIVAEMLAQQGDQDAANWLRNLAVQLATATADRFFQQGIQQYQRSQFKAALQSWQQALTIYRAIGDRQGEANSLGSLGVAYYSLGQYQQGIGCCTEMND